MKDLIPMNRLRVFKNDRFGDVRVTEIAGDPWFVGKDVAEVLGYENPTKAIRDHVDAEDRTMGVQNGTPSIRDALGREQTPTWINESGLYSLIMSSKLPNAHQFQRWVTSEVLPSIRKHGAYATAAVIDNILADPDYGIRLLEELKAERERNAVLQPKADYFDALVERNTLTGIRATAKALCVKQKAFTGFLVENGYLYRDNTKKLQPYAKHIEDGLFVLKECKSDRNGWSGTQLLITPKGRETFRLLIKTSAA